MKKNEELERAIKILEVAFAGDDIKRNLNNVIKLLAEFTNSEDIQIYKYDNSKKRVYNYISLKDKSSKNNKMIESYLLKGYYDGFLDSPESNLKSTMHEIDTGYNRYVMVIKNKNDINGKINSRYINIVKRFFKLVLEKIEDREVLRKAYLTDPLTGIGNRAYYREVTEKLIKDNRTITYALIDLFRLKYINDKFTHIKGDEYIKKASLILKETFPNEKQVFRLGGDEFVVISSRMNKDTMKDLLKKADLKLNKETLGLTLEQPLSLNYGVARGSGNIDRLYVEADDELSKNKKLIYKKYNINRRT